MEKQRGMGVLGIAWRLLINLPLLIIAIPLMLVMMLIAVVDTLLGKMFG